MPLSKDEHLSVVNKLTQSLEKLTPQEVPAFVYQMLKLCKQQNNIGLFVRLQSYFGNKVYSRLTTPETESMELDVIGINLLNLIINFYNQIFNNKPRNALH